MEETQVAERDSEEEQRRKEEHLAAAKAFFASAVECIEAYNKVNKELDDWARSLVQAYLDAEGIEGRRIALDTIRKVLAGEVEGSDERSLDDLREWLSQLGFTFADDAAMLCGVPDDETLAWRLAHAPGFNEIWPLSLAEDSRYAKEAAEANVDWFCEDPNELRRISEALDAENPEKALQVEETEQFLGDVRRAIELEEKPETRRRLQQLAEDLEHRIEA